MMCEFEDITVILTRAMLCNVMVILCYMSNMNYVQPTFKFELGLSGIDNILIIFKKMSQISHIRKNRNF